MKAACCDKENKGRDAQQEYRHSLIEMAPLFPSLHVNDAGKTGIMGNRMALHEQFTVSPQRFAQLSAPCRSSAAPYSCSEECVLKECHHLSTSHLPVVPTSSNAQGFACSFFGTMDDTTVCDSKSAGSNALLDAVAMTTKDDNLKHIAAITADPQLPSNCSALDKAESNDGQALCHTPAADVMKLVKGAQYLSIGDGSQCVSDLRQADLAPKSEGYAYMSCESAEVGGKVIMKDEVLITGSKQEEDTSCKEHGRRTMRALSNECCSDSIGIKSVHQSKGSDTEGVPIRKPILNDVEVPGPRSAEGHTVIIEGDLEHLKENLPHAMCPHDSLIESSSICKIAVETAVDTDISTKPSKGFSSILDTNNRENTGKAPRETPCFPVRSRCGACGESANKNSSHCAVAESSQEDIEMGNSLNDSESCCPLSLSPKAVIQEIGQLRFWKARLALIRQQRIFSDQVFELHKLIEVQRLLAGTPYTSIDEIYFGVGNMNLECEADALVSNSGLVDKKDNVGDALGKQVLVSYQTVEFPMVMGEEAKMESTNSPARLQQSAAVPGVEKREVSAFAYPNLGVEHSAGSLPAAGACPYRPFAGGFTPGSAVGGPFAAPVLDIEGAAMIQSPMIPFSFPVCLEKPQLTPSVQFSYGSAIASADWQYCTPYHNSFSGHEVSIHSGPRMLYKTYGAAEGPTASVATISSQPDMSKQKVEVENPSSFISKIVQPRRKGLTMSGSEPENIQHTVMGLKFKSSSVRPANDSWECSEHNEKVLSQTLDMKHHDNDPGKKESLFKEERGCKRQKERKQQDLLTMSKLVDVNNSLNPSLGPLNLFPLAPTLSLDEHSKRRPSGMAGACYKGCPSGSYIDS